MGMFKIASDTVWQARLTSVRVAGASLEPWRDDRRERKRPLNHLKGEGASAYIRGSSRSQRFVSMTKERGFEHLPWVSLVIPL